MKNISAKSYIMIAIVFAVYSVVSFVVPFVRGAGFWIAYLCTALLCGVAAWAFHKQVADRKNNLSRILGWPIFHAARTMLIVQVVLSYGIMATGKWVPMWVCVLAEVIVLALTAIFMLSKAAAQEVIVQSEAAPEANTAAMKELRSTVKSLAATCPELQHLSDRLAVSDPVSNGEEAELAACVAEIRAMVLGDARENLPAMIAKAERLLTIRNEAVRAGKRQSR